MRRDGCQTKDLRRTQTVKNQKDKETNAPIPKREDPDEEYYKTTMIFFYLYVCFPIKSLDLKHYLSPIKI